MSSATGTIGIIVTGATGMLGEGVLAECLAHPAVARVLSVSRRSSGVVHEKMKEVLVPDFADLRPIRPLLDGYDACLYCLGSSPLGRTEEEYREVTVSLATRFADVLVGHSSVRTFCFISSAGAEARGRFMWQRVKAEAELALGAMPIERLFCFRPAVVRMTKGLKHAHLHYRVLDCVMPFAKRLFPNRVCTLRELGLAMIEVAAQADQRSRVLEVADIVEMSRAADRA